MLPSAILQTLSGGLKVAVLASHWTYYQTYDKMYGNMGYAVSTTEAWYGYGSYPHSYMNVAN